MEDKKINRRKFIKKIGLGSATALASTSIIASKLCEDYGATMNQVMGPFPPRDFNPENNPGEIVTPAENDLDLSQIRGAAARAKGQLIEIRGRVLGEDCGVLEGALVQTWQTDHEGHYNHLRDGDDPETLDPNFAYWGSTTTDKNGEFLIKTIVPKEYQASSNWWRPPHIHWIVRDPKRNHKPTTTQSYFEGDALESIDKIRQFNKDDLILNLRDSFKPRGVNELEHKKLVEKTHKQLIVKFEENENKELIGKIEFVLAKI